MARLARDRDTHLTREEIVSQALAQFDAGDAAPSIRPLAKALQVAPGAIYHHFGSVAEIYQGSVDLVWGEVAMDFFAVLPDPEGAAPLDVIVSAGVATRRSFLRHHHVAPYVAATPPTPDALEAQLAILGDALERMGVTGEQAGACFHAFSSFTMGSIVFAAQRRIADEALGSQPRPSQPPARDATHAAMQAVTDMSTRDPERDEELFAGGLRQLVASFVPASA